VCHRRSAAPRIIIHIFASFIKVSHPSPRHSITHGMLSVHLTKLTTHRTMCKHGLIVCKLRLCLPKGPTNSACMLTIVTTALQRQYLQMEIILWMCHVFWKNSCQWSYRRGCAISKGGLLAHILIKNGRIGVISTDNHPA
jgi:hypothetical protein